ncbi:hypothetical protein P5E39_12665 [Clostridium perfringens]|nr:hypothetical protein [Clostridium perfringens]MDM0495354.1 hypothetical protein [Clostridium perfringens]
MIEKILMEYNNTLIDYKTEKILMNRLLFDSRYQLIEEFKRKGFFIRWVEKYNAKGKKLYIPSKMKS